MQVEVCSLYSSEVSRVAVNICVLAVSANVTHRELQQQRHLLGTAAVIFVTSLTDADFLSMQVSFITVIIVKIFNTKTETICSFSPHLFPFYFSLSFIGFTYFLLLSIPSLSTRIVPLRFQAGGRRRRPNLVLVFFVFYLCYLYSLVKMHCGVLLGLVT